ncbi:uncharacterized protein LOC132723812 [Ruditapes philippinarum]|uniref:uncharacterized protein LOC132723812 n=1 Tax=Ruditapes philippinarum TaxID=129788 RepID=UPI00295A9414|nr:uncharacterized protein LOC132723812 [Ruditapes philippinarum]
MSRFRYLHKRPGVPENYTSSAVNMETEVECVPKADKSRWTVAEESTLIDLVLGNENLLFGALAGPNKESIRRSRQKCWDDICQQLNSQFINSKKDVAGIKKKFSNIKQRTKEKIDNAKKK